MSAVVPVRLDQIRTCCESTYEAKPKADADPTRDATGITTNNLGNGRPSPSAAQNVASSKSTKDGGTISATARTFDQFPASPITR